MSIAANNLQWSLTTDGYRVLASLTKPHKINSSNPKDNILGNRWKIELINPNNQKVDCRYTRTINLSDCYCLYKESISEDMGGRLFYNYKTNRAIYIGIFQFDFSAPPQPKLYILEKTFFRDINNPYSNRHISQIPCIMRSAQNQCYLSWKTREEIKETDSIFPNTTQEAIEKNIWYAEEDMYRIKNIEITKEREWFQTIVKVIKVWPRKEKIESETDWNKNHDLQLLHKRVVKLNKNKEKKIEQKIELESIYVQFVNPINGFYKILAHEILPSPLNIGSIKETLDYLKTCDFFVHPAGIVYFSSNPTPFSLDPEPDLPNITPRDDLDVGLLIENGSYWQNVESSDPSGWVYPIFIE